MWQGFRIHVISSSSYTNWHNIMPRLGGYDSPKQKGSDNRVVTNNDTKVVKQDVHVYSSITYNSFIMSGNYFSKIMYKYVHASNTTNCWIYTALPKST